MAAEIDVGVGSIRNHLDKLMAEGFLQGLKTDPKLSNEGFHLLHDFWPDEFSYAEQSKLCPKGRHALLNRHVHLTVQS